MRAREPPCPVAVARPVMSQGGLGRFRRRAGRHQEQGERHGGGRQCEDTDLQFTR